MLHTLVDFPSGRLYLQSNAWLVKYVTNRKAIRMTIVTEQLQ
jgi:hypothetical protein